MITHRAPISGVDFHVSGVVATAGYDNQIILWDFASQRAVSRSMHDHLANQCHFSACGRLLTTASSDYSARVWEVPSLRLRSVLNEHEDDVEMAVFSPDAQRVATASRDGLVRIFGADGKGAAVSCRGHAEDVVSVAWDRLGTEVVSSSDDGTIRRWCATSGRQLQLIELGKIQTDTVVHAEDGTIVAGNDEGMIFLLRADGSCVEYHCHNAGVKRLALDRDQSLLLSASYDRTVKLWSLSDVKRLEQIREYTAPASIWMRSCVFAGPFAIFGTFGGSYARLHLKTREWDVKDAGESSGLNAVATTGGRIYSVGDAGLVFCDGREVTRVGSSCNFLGGWPDHVVTGGQAGALFEVGSAGALHQHRSPLNCSATFVREGCQYLIVGSYTGDALVFRREGNVLRFLSPVQLHPNAIKGIACDAECVFTVCANGDAAIHSLDGFECLRRIPSAHSKIANGVVRLTEGQFASVGRDLMLRIWSKDGSHCFRTPHDHSVKCVTSSLDGRFIATGSYAGDIAVFDSLNRTWIRSERLSTFGISCVVPLKDDGFIASSYDGSLYRF